MRLFHPITYCLVVAAMVGVCFADADKGGFVLTADDLPTARVSGYQVVFTRNGAFVLGKEGRWLLDGGIGFATPGWEQWGTQIRRSGHEDHWSHTEGQPDKLTFSGTLFDKVRNARFYFDQEVTRIAGGLRFEYRVRPLQPMRIAEFGIFCHFPVREHRKGNLDFWPGFDRAAFSKAMDNPVVFSGAARAAVVHNEADALAAIVGSGRENWFVFDDRKWELNVFRSYRRCPDAASRLSKGEAAEIRFDLLLGSGIASALPMGNGDFEVRLDRYGHAAVWRHSAKMCEIGIVSGSGAESSVSWLHENSEPAGTPSASGGEGQPSISYRTHGEKPLDVTITKRSLGDRVEMLFQAVPMDPENSPESLAVTVAVPRIVVERPPRAVSGGENGDADLPNSATIPLKEGRFIVLRSEAPWQVSAAPRAWGRSHMLTAEMGKSEDGGFALRVWAEARQPSPDDHSKAAAE